MFKTPPQNKSAASTEDSNKRTEKPAPMTGKDKGSTSSVRKSVGELESRLGATPKNIIVALPTKQTAKLPPANVGDDNQVDKEMTKGAVTGSQFVAEERKILVAQANLQRKELATSELMLEASKKGMSFALIQEPYVGRVGYLRDYRGARIFQSAKRGEGVVKAAIAVFDNNIYVTQCPTLTTNNIVTIKMQMNTLEIGLISLYLEPDSPIEPYINQLKKIVTKMGKTEVIIGGDTNAWSQWWGSAKEDGRGEALAGALNELGLHVLNEGDVPTFDTIRGGKRFSSHVDITACSENLLKLVDDWKVHEGITSSDHNTILFKIKSKYLSDVTIKRTTRVYNSKKAKWSQFRKKLTQLLTDKNITKTEIDNIKHSKNLENHIEKYLEVIKEVCESTIPKKKNQNKLTLPWWNDELVLLKKDVTTKKRRIRCAAPVRKADVVAAYLEAKSIYENEAKKAQVKSWKEFCGRQDREGLWDGIYRVIGRTTKRHEDLPLFKGGKILDNIESAKMLAETFYPRDQVEADNAEHQRIRELAEKVNEGTQDNSCDPPFTVAELKYATNSFNPKKAPGGDGFTADICQHTILHNPELYLSLANKCLELGHFPTVWKKAVVVVLRKPGKEDYTHPKAYRPIGLLSVMGKILEKMTIRRIRWHIQPGGSTRQYGFTPQKSTEDSLYDMMEYIRTQIQNKKIIIMVSLDIEGAFDGAWWPAIRYRLAEEKCPINIRRLMDSYLQDRKVSVRYAGVEYNQDASKGCVQGSIGGPVLWNLLLDPLLKELEARGDRCQAFADDIVLLFAGDTALEIQRRANAALEHVRRWGIRNKLNFAPHKTKAMLITNKLKYDSPRLSMGGIDIGMSEEIKVLGLTVDRKLTFKSHVKNVCRKATALYTQLSRAAKISWGLQPEIIRTIYVAVAEPVALYAASAWAPAVSKLGVRRLLNTVQRGFAQKIIKAYRTVSLHSALALAGLLPLDLRIQESASLFRAKRGKLPPILEDRELIYLYILYTHYTIDATRTYTPKMFGIRTPTKPTQSPSKTGSEISKVRRSIDDWESNIDSTPSMTTTTMQAGTAKTKPTGSVLQNSKTTQKVSVEIHTPPKQQYENRTMEAKACLTKGKLHLNASRNTKTEIKNGVVEALDRLYQLVKEAEMELKAKKAKGEKEKSAQVEQAHYKIIQANLQRKKLATHELFIEAEKRRADIALLQEPYVGGANTMKGQRGVRVFQNSSPGEGTVKAAVAVFNVDFNIKQYPKLTTNNIIVVGIQTRAWEITLVSYYFEPDQPIEPYIDHLKKIEQEIGSTKWIAGGDANSKSTWWGSPIVDHRGEEIAGAFEELGLNILNRGDIPTFDTIRGGKRYSSYVDITACSTDILDLVDDWTVDEGLTSSDHNGIIFNIRLQKSKGLRVNRTTRLFNTKKANWPKFHEKLNQLLSENQFNKSEIENIETIEQIDIATDKLTISITDTCKQTMPTKKATEELTLPWWSDKLNKMKKEVTTMKRRIKCAALVRRQKVVEEYLEQKERYESEAIKAQIESWKYFCCKQDKEGVWEGIYRVIGRTTRRDEDQPLEINKVVLDAKGSVKLLAETFFPEDLTDSENTYHRHVRIKADKVNSAEQDDLCDPLFTMLELKQAYRSFNPKKAPGADGFTADICLHAIESNPELFLTFLNKCLTLQHFPKTWKIATVIVLKKPGKVDYTMPKAYRPIGLLPILGKIFEKMLVNRLKFHLLPRISTRQYGFMPQRSTEDALYVLMQFIHMKLNQKKIIALVSLDIEGAFDSAWWPAIRVRLAEERCPLNLRRVIDSYLKDRKVVVRYAGEEYAKGTSRGCVQGSIGGPILWNLLLDPLLKSLECRGDYCQAFADDVVLVFDGDTAHEVERRANATLEHVCAWGVENKLKFAPHKTNAMIITRKLKHDVPRLNMGGTAIGMSKEIKLLGFTIDEKLTFNTHVSNVCKKAIGIYKQLCKAAKVSWGLHPEVIRVIYLATVEPIILYAASVWAQAAKKLGIIKQLAVVQRGIAQKLCKAYRTVSLNSALVLAGILPLDLRVREAALLYEAKRGLPQPVLAGREVERMASAFEGPHPAERLELGIICLVNEEQRSIRMATLDKWNQRYQTGETGKITKLFFPDAKVAYRIIRKFEASSETTQVMTGHGGFSEYLHRFKCKENPSCICDRDAEETVPHILLDCPAYAAERLKIENEIELKLIKENINIIMMSKYREKFMSYCLKIAKRVINRNKTV
ncbi:unnamed protein product [Parnassius mnemosyne]|uniref:Reverse transcriptase domain-containing protein n=1 Tax=Parnassius mnemosyne TaxID=213953 RepID=A0AAV1M8M2_9NEOP